MVTGCVGLCDCCLLTPPLLGTKNGRVFLLELDCALCGWLASFLSLFTPFSGPGLFLLETNRDWSDSCFLTSFTFSGRDLLNFESDCLELDLNKSLKVCLCSSLRSLSFLSSGLLDSTSGLLETSSGLLETTSGLLETSSGLLDSISGLLDSTSGLLDSTSGLLDSTSGLLDSTSGFLDSTFFSLVLLPAF